MVAPLLRMVASRRFMKALMPQQYLSCGAHQSPALVCFCLPPGQICARLLWMAHNTASTSHGCTVLALLWLRQCPPCQHGPVNALTAGKCLRNVLSASQAVSDAGPYVEAGCAPLWASHHPLRHCRLHRRPTSHSHKSLSGKPGPLLYV